MKENALSVGKSSGLMLRERLSATVLLHGDNGPIASARPNGCEEATDRFCGRFTSRRRTLTMAKLGSKKRPAVVRVQTQEKAQEILSLCNEHGWIVIAGIEPDEPEDISDVERLLNPPTVRIVEPKIRRNDPCPCGSGLKYKHCCGR